MSLTSLPVELLNRICSYLDQAEWAALRLSCHSLCETSSQAFACRFLRSICFIATSEGLRQLEMLVQSNMVTTHARELWMIPTVFEGRHDMNQFCFKRSRSIYDELTARYTIYQAIVADHLALVESDAFATRLHKCFLSFKNLNSVGLKHYATSFLLDKRQTEFDCLGLQDLRDKIDFVSHPSSFCHLQWRQAASINSLSMSGIFQGLNGSNQRIKSLHTCSANFCGSMSPEISLAQEQYDSLLRCLGELEFLHMCICYGKKESSHTSSFNTWLDLLLAVSPDLKALEFSQWCEVERGMDQSYFSKLSRSIKFTRLKELRLHWIQVRYESLKSFITAAKGTLETLTFELVTLKDDSISSTGSNPASWQRVWDFLAIEVPMKKFFMANIGYKRLKVLIRGPDSSVEPTYSVSFDAEVADICFSEWVGQLIPVTLDKYYDITVRNYPAWLPRGNRSEIQPPPTPEMIERRRQPLWLGSNTVTGI